MRRFIFYPVFFIFILFLLETTSLGMGVKPTEVPTQEPTTVSPAPAEKQEQGTLNPDAEKPPRTIQPEPMSSKPGETGSLVQPPTQIPTEVKQPAPGQVRPVEQVVPPKTPQMPAAGGSVTFFFDDADIFEVAQDGETIIIGGPIREDITKSRSGIPFLSKIPILGYLFGSTIDESIRTELIILLTPRVIKNQAEAAGVTSDYVDKYKGSTKDKNIDEFIKDKGKKEQDGKDTKNKDFKYDTPYLQRAAWG